MERLIRIEMPELEHALRLSPGERLRQANAAFRLYYSLHQPYARPYLKGFQDLAQFTRYNEEAALRLGPVTS